MEMSTVVQESGGWSVQGSVVGRIRDLLVALDAAGDGRRAPSDATAEVRTGEVPVAALRDRGGAERDFHQIVSRLRRLREVLPELAGVEAGPLVLPAWERVAERRVNGDGEGLLPPRRSGREAGR